MNSPSSHLARQPQQQRARQRFEDVLVGAEKLLLDKGLDGFNISELAQDLGYTRASIYKFFPTPQAVFHEINSRQLDRLEEKLRRRVTELQSDCWEAQLHEVTTTAAEFHNDNPVAGLLILGPVQGESAYRSLHSMIGRLGDLLAQVMAANDLPVSREPVDHAMLTVEIATACLRTSYHLHGHITPAYETAAWTAMVAYLRQVLNFNA